MSAIPHGMDAATGRPLSGEAHLVQSIRDILTTPIGTRVMRRDYGSKLVDLLDRPMLPGFLVDVVAAIAEALDRWEPRFRLTRVSVDEASPGRATVTLEGVYRPDGREITVEGLVVG